jgi:antitoxin ParD1/3/4
MGAEHQQDGAEIERWLQNDVVTAFDRMKSSPVRAIPAEAAFAAVRSRHAERTKHPA